MSEGASTFITRVVLKNYKSIAACDVSLGPLTFLVGPNGSGKSNFLDALRFVSDALNTSLDHAIRERGGINEVRRRSSGHPTHFGIRLEFKFDDGARGYYAFRVGAQRNAGYEVQNEEIFLQTRVYHVNLERYVDDETIHVVVRNGRVVLNGRESMKAPGDRLFLPIAPIDELWDLSRWFASMGIYNFSPDQMRDFQSPDAGTVLARDGRNIAGVLDQMTRERSDLVERVEAYLEQVAPDIRGVSTRAVGNRETLEFRQAVSGAKDPWRFPASSVSDGTLRALGILVALFHVPRAEHRQTILSFGTGIPLVGLEEPESALHPAGAGVLFDALREASRFRQVLVTSHSPDLLDNKQVETDSILAVVSESGETQIGPVEDVGRSALRDHLYTVGDLMRMDQLRPTSGKPARQARLFSDGAA